LIEIDRICIAAYLHIGSGQIEFVFGVIAEAELPSLGKKRINHNAVPHYCDTPDKA
jgi:hypothetical protein